MIDLTTMDTEALKDLKAQIAAELKRRESPSPDLPAGCQIFGLTSGNIAIITPFHPLFVDELKAKFPAKWISLKVKEGEKPVDCWSVDRANRSAVEASIQAFYGQELIERVILFENDESTLVGPTVDGFDLAYINVDQATPRRIDSPVVQLISWIESTLETGGSRRTPWVKGTLKARVRCRRDAVLRFGARGTATIIEE